MDTTGLRIVTVGKVLAQQLRLAVHLDLSADQGIWRIVRSRPVPGDIGAENWSAMAPASAPGSSGWSWIFFMRLRCATAALRDMRFTVLSVAGFRWPVMEAGYSGIYRSPVPASSV